MSLNSVIPAGQPSAATAAYAPSPATAGSPAAGSNPDLITFSNGATFDPTPVDEYGGGGETYQPVPDTSRGGTTGATTAGGDLPIGDKYLALFSEYTSDPQLQEAAMQTIANLNMNAAQLEQTYVALATTTEGRAELASLFGVSPTPTAPVTSGAPGWNEGYAQQYGALFYGVSGDAAATQSILDELAVSEMPAAELDALLKILQDPKSAEGQELLISAISDAKARVAASGTAVDPATGQPVTAQPAPGTAAPGTAAPAPGAPAAEGAAVAPEAAAPNGSGFATALGIGMAGVGATAYGISSVKGAAGGNRMVDDLGRIARNALDEANPAPEARKAALGLLDEMGTKKSKNLAGLIGAGEARSTLSPDQLAAARTTVMDRATALNKGGGSLFSAAPDLNRFLGDVPIHSVRGGGMPKFATMGKMGGGALAVAGLATLALGAVWAGKSQPAAPADAAAGAAGVAGQPGAATGTATGTGAPAAGGQPAPGATGTAPPA
ncbi:MAG: hypothetical protein JWM90_1178 [Thermoleophilia bacterium]|nr:hypothetical protein [Thermoleophilia bacterium]